MVVTEANRESIREHIIEGLSWVRDIARSDIDAEIGAHDGDLRLDSKEGEAVCVIVEDALGLGELVQACDLQPEQLTSISALTRLFEQRITNQPARNAKDLA